MSDRQKFAPAQLAYCAAKAALATLEPDYRAALALLPKLDRNNWTEDEMHDHCERVAAVDEATGYGRARHALILAEDLLFRWARDEVKTNPVTAARFGQVAKAFTDGPKSFTLRPKLIEICMAMEASHG